MPEFPPPSWPPPGAAPGAAPAGILERWRGAARWKRWTAYGVTGLVVVTALGAVAGPDEPSSIRTATDSGVQPTSSSTLALADPPPTSTPTSTQPTTPAPTILEPPTTPATTTPVVPTTGLLSGTVPSPAVSPPDAPGQLLAIDVLAMIPIEREQGAGYNRELFGYGAPIDGFGCRTRALVLIRDSLTPPQIDRGGCAVVAGDWFSTYDGLTWSDPGEIEIDHVVALKEAWDSGANAWNAARLEAFSNDVDDVRTLRAVTGATNAAKSDNDPTNWLPPAPDAVCGYLADWVSIKARWGLSMDESEHGRIRNLLTDRCPGQTIAPWVEVPPGAPTDPVSPLPASPLPPSAPAPAAPPVGGNCDPSYPGVCIPPSPPDLDCGDITCRRFQVLSPDPHRFDGDNDGVGCES